VVMGECESGAEAMYAIRQLGPDLLLLDVQMHDGTGLDVIAEIGPERMPAVIFVTAYDEYAVKAFELDAVDYLLKPFDDERLNRSIDRAKKQIVSSRAGALADQLHSLLETKSERGERWPERLVVRTGEQFDLVPVHSIEGIESANNYVQLHCGTRHLLMGETLTNLAERLNPQRFMRIHRGRIINVSRVISVHPLFSGTYEVELSGGTRLSTGRQYREQIQALLKS
ncbi:MAG: LytR/AlgR family response regulator transcription factor, partial [Acidobacteriaceae bacterium]